MASSDEEDYFSTKMNSSNLHSLFQTMDTQAPVNYNSNLFFVPPKQPKQRKKAEVKSQSQNAVKEQASSIKEVKSDTKKSELKKDKVKNDKSIKRVKKISEDVLKSESTKIDDVNIRNFALPEPTPLLIEEAKQDKVESINHNTKHNIVIIKPKIYKKPSQTENIHDNVKTNDIQVENDIVKNNEHHIENTHHDHVKNNDIQVKNTHDDVKISDNCNVVINNRNNEKQNEIIDQITAKSCLELHKETISKLDNLSENINSIVKTSVEDILSKKLENLEVLLRKSSNNATNCSNTKYVGNEELENRISLLESELENSLVQIESLEEYKRSQKQKMLEFQKGIKKAMSKLYNKTSELLLNKEDNLEIEQIEDILAEDFKITTYQLIGKAKEIIDE